MKRNKMVININKLKNFRYFRYVYTLRCAKALVVVIVYVKHIKFMGNLTWMGVCVCVVWGLPKLGICRTGS